MIESFYHAFHGIWIGLRHERNLRIHFLAAVAVIGLGLWLKLDSTSWVLLAFAIGAVITCELFNSSLEHLVDISADKEYHESARYAKDTAAAAVLCASVMSVVVGLLVLGPRLLATLAK